MDHPVELPLDVHLDPTAEREVVQLANMADVGEDRLHDSNPVTVKEPAAPRAGVPDQEHRPLDLVPPYLGRGRQGSGTVRCGQRIASQTSATHPKWEESESENRLNKKKDESEDHERCQSYRRNADQNGDAATRDSSH